MSENQASKKADYGLDAPGVVRNLFIAGLTSLLVLISILCGFWSGIVSIPISGDALKIDFSGMALGCSVTMLAGGIWMVWSSKIGKLKSRDELLDLILWNGSENVLDLGCGRGLLLIGAAKRLSSGRAYGIDIWQTEDLSGNSSEATLKNIRIEGVEDKAEIRTGDMRQLPFTDSTFDVIVSRAVIHNLYASAEREKAILEAIRVLKPGGIAVIEDIRHVNEYAAVFKKNCNAQIEIKGSRIIASLTALITLGSLRPGTLIVNKPS